MAGSRRHRFDSEHVQPVGVPPVPIRRQRLGRRRRQQLCPSAGHGKHVQPDQDGPQERRRRSAERSV